MCALSMSSILVVVLISWSVSNEMRLLRRKQKKQMCARSWEDRFAVLIPCFRLKWWNIINVCRLVVKIGHYNQVIHSCRKPISYCEHKYDKHWKEWLALREKLTENLIFVKFMLHLSIILMCLLLKKQYWWHSFINCINSRSLTARLAPRDGEKNRFLLHQHIFHTFTFVQI